MTDESASWTEQQESLPSPDLRKKLIQTKEISNALSVMTHAKNLLNYKSKKKHQEALGILENLSLTSASSTTEAQRHIYFNLAVVYKEHPHISQEHITLAIKAFNQAALAGHPNAYHKMAEICFNAAKNMGATYQNLTDEKNKISWKINSNSTLIPDKSNDLKKNNVPQQIKDYERMPAEEKRREDEKEQMNQFRNAHHYFYKSAVYFNMVESMACTGDFYRLGLFHTKDNVIAIMFYLQALNESPVFYKEHKFLDDTDTADKFDLIGFLKENYKDLDSFYAEKVQEYCQRHGIELPNKKMALMGELVGL